MSVSKNADVNDPLKVILIKKISSRETGLAAAI